eukprot:SAG25_NODE_2_length_31535_cov_18.197322_6_plen_58_part_00
MLLLLLPPPPPERTAETLRQLAVRTGVFACLNSAQHTKKAVTTSLNGSGNAIGYAVG